VNECRLKQSACICAITKSNSNVCGARCRNTDGGFTCSCGKGYSLHRGTVCRGKIICRDEQCVSYSMALSQTKLGQIILWRIRKLSFAVLIWTLDTRVSSTAELNLTNLWNYKEKQHGLLQELVDTLNSISCKHTRISSTRWNCTTRATDGGSWRSVFFSLLLSEYILLMYCIVGKLNASNVIANSYATKYGLWCCSKFQKCSSSREPPIIWSL